MSDSPAAFSSDLTPSAVPQPESLQVLEALDTEHLLAETARLLATGASSSLTDILALLGGAVGAEYAYFTFASEEFVRKVRHAPGDETDARSALPVPTRLLGKTFAWSRTGVPRAGALDLLLVTNALNDSHGEGHAVRGLCLIDDADGQYAFAIPLLSEEDQFVGYLGFELSHGVSPPEGSPQVLSVVGEVIGAHLSRLAAEEARQHTEARWQQLVDRYPEAIVVTVREKITYANVAAVRLFGATGALELCGLHYRDFLSADDEARIEAGQQTQLCSAAPQPFEHTVFRLDGDERIVESVSVPFPGVEGAVQTVLRDVTESKMREQRYRTFVETISEGVWRIDLDLPLHGVHVAGRQEADEGPVSETQAEHILAHGRLAELNPAMSRMFWLNADPVGRPIHALVKAGGMPLFRALADARYRLNNYEMAVPASSGPTRYVSVNAVGQFDRHALVGIWGSCTDITDRIEMERGMVDALEEQQERIGRDLHDSVGQLLTGVRMLSENLAARSKEPDVAPTAQRVSDYASEALTRVREICRGLVPPQLYSEGVAAALAELVDHVDALGSLRCTYHHDARADLVEPDVSLQFYRIAQEALGNALKHAQASRVWISFHAEGDDVVMEVRDNGIGFVLDRSRPRSLGMFSMRRRAHIADATLTIETQPGRGTTVRVARPRSTRRGSIARHTV